MKKYYAVLLLISFSLSGFSQRTQKPPLHGKNWMAITGKPLAATAGAQLFERGGNAVDAACAMLAATCTMWEIIRFGRTARGERFLDGNWRSHTEVWRDQNPLWIDRQYLNGNTEMLGSPNGLNNYAIAANFIFVGATVEPELITRIRSTW